MYGRSGQGERGDCGRTKVAEQDKRPMRNCCVGKVIMTHRLERNLSSAAPPKLREDKPGYPRVGQMGGGHSGPSELCEVPM